MPLEIKLPTVPDLKQSLVVKTFLVIKGMAGLFSLSFIVKVPLFYSIKQQMGQIFFRASVF